MPGLTPQEEAVVRATLDAGYLTRADVDAALAACEELSRTGRFAGLLPLLAQRLRPEQLAHLRQVHQSAPAHAAPVPSGPRKIAGFTVLRELGEGGMGMVFLAHDPRLDREVALKVVLPGADHEALERLRREALAAARLEHPGLVRLHCVENDAHGRLVIALEVLRGGSLAERLKRDGPLPPREAAALVAQLARAMQYAHDQGVLHRDLKPANVLLTEDGAPKITDFGLAKQHDDAHGLTKTGVIMGSPGYMAPEQAAGEHDRVDQRADVYGLGATLFTLLTGRPPFQGSLVEVLAGLLTKNPPTLRSVDPAIDPALDAICLAAIAREPEDRTLSAADLAGALEAYLADLDRAPESGSSSWLLLAALAVLTLVVGGATWLFLKRAPLPTIPASATRVTKTKTPSPGASKAPTPTPKGWVLDGRSLMGSAKANPLEVWGPWLVSAGANGGLSIRGNAQTSPELSLPVNYRTGAFSLELTGTLHLLEVGNAFQLALHPWRPDGPRGPAIAVQLSAVRAKRRRVALDSRWVGGLHPTPSEPLRPRIERAPGAAFRLVLTHTPPGHVELRIGPRDGGDPWYEGTAELSEPLKPGPYRLRLGSNLRTRKGYEAVYIGRSPDKGGYPDYRLDVRDLRLAIRPTSRSLRLNRSDDPGRTAELGRVLRAAWSDTSQGRAAALERLLAIIVPMKVKGVQPTHMASAKYAAARLLAEAGRFERAATLLSELHQAMAMQSGGLKGDFMVMPPVTNWFHARWSRDLFASSDKFLTALKRSSPSWKLLQGQALQAQVETLKRQSVGEVLLSGARLSPDDQREWSAPAKIRSHGPYLNLFKAAHLIVLLHDDERLTSTEAHCWTSLGGLERVTAIGRRLLPAVTPPARKQLQVLLGSLAFRRAEWKEARDLLESSGTTKPRALQMLAEAQRMLDRQ